jgi:hypothetical protein
LHRIDVTVVQEVVPHTVEATAVVGVASEEPKLVPITVRLKPALVGPLGLASDVIAGESNVNAPSLVPTSDERVAMIVASFPTPEGRAHMTLESVDQTVVSQADEPIRTDGVALLKPKFTPDTDTFVASGMVGPLGASAEETTGESYVKILNVVPTAVDSRTATWLDGSRPAGVRHRIVD